MYLKLLSQAFQRSFVALSHLEDDGKELEAVKHRNNELILEVTKSRDAQTEAETARRVAEAARIEAEEEALSLKGEALEMEISLADKDRTINEMEQAFAAMEQAMAEMKLAQSAREDEAYNDGVRNTSVKYKRQILEAREALFTKGWTSALKKAAIPEGSSLYNVESPFMRPAAAPHSPLSTSSSHAQHPPAPLE